MVASAAVVRIAGVGVCLSMEHLCGGLPGSSGGWSRTGCAGPRYASRSFLTSYSATAAGVRWSSIRALVPRSLLGHREGAPATAGVGRPWPRGAWPGPLGW